MSSFEGIPAQYIGLTKLSSDGSKILKATFQKCKDKGVLMGNELKTLI